MRGQVRDRLWDRDGHLAWDSGWRGNLIVWRGLDLVGALLTCQRGIQGLRFLAVGTGDPAWGTAPPAPRATDTQLVAEVARSWLVPGAELSYDPTNRTVLVTVTFGPDDANGELRELGLFGGDASARAGSGWLVNCLRHAPVVKQQGQSLERTVRLTPPANLEPGAAELIGQLLARESGARGITHFAFGDGSRSAGATTLGAERFRLRLGGASLSYDRRSRTVHAAGRLQYDQGPTTVREIGLFGEAATDTAGSGLLVAYQQVGPTDRTKPTPLTEELDMVLTSADPVAVPDVGGKAWTDAQSAIEAAGLAPEIGAQRVDDGHPRGTVLAQSPAAGASAHAGVVVSVTLSIPTQVVVPRLVGATEQTATTLLQSVGLTVDQAGSTQRQDPAPSGTVLASDPAAGNSVDKGSAVRLVLATPILVPVPDLRGQTPDAALALLARTGLSLAPGPYQTVESAATIGAIVNQQPPGGQQAATGSTITPRLATPFTVAIPDLTGQTVDQAATLLEQAASQVLIQQGLPPIPPGLSLGARRPVEDTHSAGTVIAQVPAKNARLPLYGTVDVSVAVAPTKQVPLVLGLSQSDAAAAITGADLAVGRIVSRMASSGDAEAAGTVVDQTPAAGTRWPAGQPVDLTVTTPIMATVPDVIQQALDVAREALQGRGFTVDSKIAQQPGSGTAGSVQAQQPAGDSLAPLGSSVSLTLIAGVPPLVGLTEDAARAQAAAIGLDVVITEEPSDAVAGTVLTQAPAAGSAATPGLKVQLTVAIARTVAVPNLVGDDLTTAQNQVTRLGLTLAVAGADPSDRPPGTVLSQTPAAGSQAARGSAVSVRTAISNQVTVPDLRSQTVQAAGALLSSLGLVLGTQTPQPGNQPQGTVVDQNPAPGAQLARGGTVNVVVATAPQPTTVATPNLISMTVDQARAALAAVGLQMATQQQASTAAPGTVLGQAPAAGAQVPVGSTVTVTIAVQRTVVVPDVTGMVTAAAERAITAVGLSAQIGRRVGLGTMVIAQSPVGGTSAPVGSTVTLTVGGQISPPEGGTHLPSSVFVRSSPVNISSLLNPPPPS